MFNAEFYPSEIAHSLCALAEEDEKTEASVTDALYDLQARCENPYNNDYFRDLYRVLEHCAIHIDNNTEV